MPIDQDVSHLLTHVRAQTEAMEQARKLYQDQLAPRFSVFNFVETDELGLSRILGWLLNPLGSHSQGGRFLQAFVAHYGIGWSDADCESASVRLEVPTHRLDTWQRRIDILVTSGDQGKAIAIENKPYALDQEKQVVAYLQQLAAVYAKQHCLVYLSGNGSSPVASSIDAQSRESAVQAGTLLITGYAGLVPWLTKCRIVSRADRVSAFIGEFSNFIEKRFMGVHDVAETEHLVSSIAGAGDLLKPALQIILAANALKRRLLEDLQKQLEQLAPDRSWHAGARLSEKWPVFWIRFDQKVDFRFLFGALDLRFDGVFCGIQLEEKDGQRDPQRFSELEAVFTKQLGKAKQEEWVWPWKIYPSETNEILSVSQNWIVSDQPWLAIQSGDLAKRIMDAAQRFRDAAIAGGLLQKAAGGPDKAISNQAAKTSG